MLLKLSMKRTKTNSLFVEIEKKNNHMIDVHWVIVFKGEDTLLAFIKTFWSLKNCHCQYSVGILQKKNSQQLFFLHLQIVTRKSDIVFPTDMNDELSIY